MASGNLAAWDVNPSGFPSSGTAVDKARFAVRYAVLAPSSHNTQPWRFIINGDELLVCADRTRSLAHTDPFDRELIISCGAALFNFRVALAYFRVPVEITTFPQSSDPDIVARVVFPASRPIFKDLAELFNAITQTHDQPRSIQRRRCTGRHSDRLKPAAALEGVDASVRSRIGATRASSDSRCEG